MKKKKFGLALGGGGARGIAHIGVIRVLLDNGIRPDLIAGSSMGALVGAFLALGKDWDELEALALSYDKKTAVRTLLDIGRLGKAVIKGEKIKKFLSENFGDAEFSDTLIPLTIVSCDLYSGEEIHIRTGRIRDAIMASICVPGIFSPVALDERIMVDGGLVNPTPIDVVRKMGADVVLGVDLISKNRQKKPDIPNMIDTLLLSYEIMRNQAMNHKLSDSSGNTIIVQPSKRELLDSFKFYDIHGFIHSGEESMSKALPELRKKLGING